MYDISIIIPAYNAERFLPKCLDSILLQSCSFAYEIICINDGSTDGTLSILDSYAAKYPHFKALSQDNKGMSAARNRGLQEASGEYVLFVDSDDWLSDGALDIIHKETNGQDVICFNASIFSEDTNTFILSKNIDERQTLSGWEYYNRFALVPQKVHFVCVWQRIYNRIFLINNDISFAEGFFRAEDNLFTSIVCYYARSVSLITEVLYVYHIHSKSITRNPTWERMLQGLEVTNRLAKFFIPKDNIDKRAVYKILASDYINLFSEEIFNLYGDKDKEISKLVDFKMFRKTAVSPRHRFLYYLIKVSPTLFRAYSKLVKKLRQ